MKSDIIRTLAFEVPGHEVGNHFADVGKMVDLGSGSRRKIDDISRRLERRAECNDLFTLRWSVA
jgi:hypothetical protein